MRVAGPGDLTKAGNDAIFLPYWLLNWEEMQAILVDRSEMTAHNQAMIVHDEVSAAKRKRLTEKGKKDVLASFTVDSPVPFDLDSVQQAIKAKNEEMVPGAGAKDKQGPFHGVFSRFLVRLTSKRADRRYGFMYQVPEDWMEYESLHRLAEMLLGHGGASKGVNSGIKVIDFSEVPSDILPVIVALVARLVFQIQFWGPQGESERHPILLVCDEAHLYLPRLSAEANPLERRGLDNFHRIAKEGRKYGVGMLVVSQRPADISTTILSQCNNFISLRLTNREDQAVVRRLMPESLEGILEILPALDIGEAVVVGDAILLPTRVKLWEPKCKPLSATIDFWRYWKREKVQSDLVRAVENMRRQARQ